MNAARKPADARRKDLKLAIVRIQKGRSHTKASKVSIASVAREAGVTPALIHNHYPEIAESIREIQARSSRVQRDEKHKKLRAVIERNRILRDEIQSLQTQVARLVSINEVLIIENRILKAKRADATIVDLLE